MIVWLVYAHVLVVISHASSHSRLLPRIYQIVEEINRRFVLKIQSMYPGNQDKVKNMAILYDGQVKMAHLAIAGSYSVNGVAALHTKILEERELKDFYEMRPEQFNNKTNGITQRRFLLHGNPLLASWITDKIGDEWIVKLSNLKKLKVYATDEKYQQEFMNIKDRTRIYIHAIMLLDIICKTDLVLDIHEFLLILLISSIYF